MPAFPSPATAAAGPAVSPLSVYHRGFALSLLHTPGRYGARSFRFEIRHHGLLLHASGGAYGTAASAERAARQFVDDALGAFECACLHLEDGD